MTPKKIAWNIPESCCFIALFLSVVGMTAFGFWGSFERFNHFGYQLADVGTFRQILWYASQGLWPYTSTNFPFNPDLPWLSFHFSVTLFILAPLYGLLGSPSWFLFFVHPLLIAITAIPVYFCCKKLFEHHRLSHVFALFFSLVFLGNHITVSTILFSFQDHSFAVPLMACCLAALIHKNFRMLCVFSLLLALCKEHYGVAVLGLGLAWALYHKDYRGLALGLTGLAYTALIVMYVMPALSESGGHAMFSSVMETEKKYRSLSVFRYDWMKQPWPDNLTSGLNIIFSESVRNYIFFLFSSFGFLPLLSPVLLLPMAADFSANILSHDAVPRNFYYYHSSVIAPVMIVALARSVSHYLRYSWFKYIFAVLFAFMVWLNAHNIEIGSLKPLGAFQARAVNAKDSAFQSLLSLIPEDAAITGEDMVLSHFANRRIVLPLTELDNTEYVILFFNDLATLKKNPDSPNYEAPPIGLLRQLIDSEEWKEVARPNGWILLKRAKADEIDKTALQALSEEINALKDYMIKTRTLR